MISELFHLLEGGDNHFTKAYPCGLKFEGQKKGSKIFRFLALLYGAVLPICGLCIKADKYTLGGGLGEN